MGQLEGSRQLGHLLVDAWGGRQTLVAVQADFLAFAELDEPIELVVRERSGDTRLPDRRDPGGHDGRHVDVGLEACSPRGRRGAQETSSRTMSWAEWQSQGTVRQAPTMTAVIRSATASAVSGTSISRRSWATWTSSRTRPRSRPANDRPAPTPSSVAAPPGTGGSDSTRSASSSTRRRSRSCAAPLSSKHIRDRVVELLDKGIGQVPLGGEVDR